LGVWILITDFILNFKYINLKVKNNKEMPKFYLFPGNHSDQVGKALKRRSKKWKQLKRKEYDKDDSKFLEKIFSKCSFIWKPTNFTSDVTVIFID